MVTAKEFWLTNNIGNQKAMSLYYIIYNLIWEESFCYQITQGSAYASQLWKHKIFGPNTDYMTIEFVSMPSGHSYHHIKYSGSYSGGWSVALVYLMPKYGISYSYSIYTSLPD